MNKRERRTVDLLVKAGADFHGVDGSQTPLMAALETGHHEAARALLDHGADPSIKDNYGNTAITYIFNYPGQDTPLPLDILVTLLDRTNNVVPNMEMGLRFTLLEMAVAFGASLNIDRESFREAVKILLARGAAFQETKDTGIQDLLQAAAKGDLASIKTAIRKGTSIDASDKAGWTALIISIALGYDECARWLMANGADVSRTIDRGLWYGPLGFAAARGETDLVLELIQKGAKPNESDASLANAVRQNNQRMFDALVKAGATPKNDAAARARILIGGESFTIKESLPLFQCIKNENVAMAKILLENGAEAEPRDMVDNRNLVYFAVEYNQPEILAALLAHGGNPSLKDDAGETPLTLAQKKHPALVPIIERALAANQK